jgi:hypothetical protein
MFWKRKTRACKQACQDTCSICRLHHVQSQREIPSVASKGCDACPKLPGGAVAIHRREN